MEVVGREERRDGWRELRGTQVQGDDACYLGLLFLSFFGVRGRSGVAPWGALAGGAKG